MRGIDDAQNLVGQREIAQDGVGEMMMFSFVEVGLLIAVKTESDSAGENPTYGARAQQEASVLCLAPSGSLCPCRCCPASLAAPCEHFSSAGRNVPLIMGASTQYDMSKSVLQLEPQNLHR